MRSSHSVKIGFCCAGKVKVDDDVDSLDINTTCEEIYHISKSTGVPSIEVADVPEQTKFLVIPFLKSWKTRLRWAWSILA